MIDGPDTRPERPALKAALNNLHAPAGPVPPGYAPPASVFPMTPAAAVAMRLSRMTPAAA